MRTIVIILYIVCFSCYVLFTRQPDYFDGEFTSGVIVNQSDKLIAAYSHAGKNFSVNVPYSFLHQPGEKVQVIYEASDPSKGQVYGFWSYWVTFGELIASLVIVGLLYWIATSVTKNPTPEALLEELESAKKKPRKPKYEL